MYETPAGCTQELCQWPTPRRNAALHACPGGITCRGSHGEGRCWCESAYGEEENQLHAGSDFRTAWQLKDGIWHGERIRIYGYTVVVKFMGAQVPPIYPS